MPAPAAARSRVTAALAAGFGGELPLGEAAELLAAAGLPMVASRVAGDVDEAVEAARDLGFPVAIKAVSRTRLAKTEAGGLALDVHDEAHVRATLERMAGALGERTWPVVVQPMAEPGVDVAVSVSDTPMVGPVLAVGPGGVATAVTAAQVHVLPLTDLEARRFVAGLPVAELLDAGGRGQLEDLLLRVGHLVDEVPEIVGVELNPVIVAPGGAAIVDAKVRIAPVDRDPVPPVRRLAGPL